MESLTISPTDPYFDYIPNEILVQICQGMTDEALLNFARTNRRANAVCHEEIQSRQGADIQRQVERELMEMEVRRKEASKRAASPRGPLGLRRPRGGMYYISPRSGSKVYMKDRMI